MPRNAPFPISTIFFSVGTKNFTTLQISHAILGGESSEGGPSGLAVAMVQAEDAGAPMGAPLPKGLRMTFRLDDGTTIRSSGEGKATVLKARESYAAGLLSETHLLRVQALLCEVHAKLPDEGPLKTLSLSSKRSAETDVEVGTGILLPCWLGALGAPHIPFSPWDVVDARPSQHCPAHVSIHDMKEIIVDAIDSTTTRTLTGSGHRLCQAVAFPEWAWTDSRCLGSGREGWVQCGHAQSTCMFV